MAFACHGNSVILVKCGNTSCVMLDLFFCLSRYQEYMGL